MACQNPSYVVRLADGLKPKFLPRRVDASYEYWYDRYGDSLMLLPCGHCPSCLTARSKEWAVRICLEASLYGDNNMFLTLTYNEENYHGPNKKDLQNFIKRLRKEIYPEKIRYYGVGELGTESGRFHYHVIIFGYVLHDLFNFKRTDSRKIIFRSPTLEKLWPFGISSIGVVTPESAKYVAGYVNKKALSGEDSGEFSLMSRRPGIGSDRFTLKWFDTGKLYSALGESSIPRYFAKILESVYPEKFNDFKESMQEYSLRINSDRSRLLLRGIKYVDQCRSVESDIYNRHFKNKRGL